MKRTTPSEPGHGFPGHSSARPPVEQAVAFRSRRTGEPWAGFDLQGISEGALSRGLSTRSRNSGAASLWQSVLDFAVDWPPRGPLGPRRLLGPRPPSAPPRNPRARRKPAYLRDARWIFHVKHPPRVRCLAGSGPRLRLKTRRPAPTVVPQQGDSGMVHVKHIGQAGAASVRAGGNAGVARGATFNVA